MDKITDRFNLPPGLLRDAVEEMEGKFEEAWKLLLRAHSFDLVELRDSETPTSLRYYLRDRVNHWGVLSQDIDAYLYPKPITLDIELDKSKLALRVWLEKGDAHVELRSGKHYMIDADTGQVRLFGTFDELWDLVRTCG